MDLRSINCVVFDFGGTLWSDLYFKLLGPRALKTIDRKLFGTEDPHIGQGWITGLLSSRDVANYLSPKTGLSPDFILSALYEGCAQIALNETVSDFAREQGRLGRKPALVTGKFDVFSQAIVPGRSPGCAWPASILRA